MTVELKPIINDIPLELHVKVGQWSDGNPNGDPSDLTDFIFEFRWKKLKTIEELSGLFDNMKDYKEAFDGLDESDIEEWINENETLIYNTWTR